MCERGRENIMCGREKKEIIVCVKENEKKRIVCVQENE